MYYVDAKNELHEICFGSDTGAWYKGSMDKLEIKVAPKSLLTVNIDDQWLKLYYQKDGGSSMYVTWVVKGEVSWSSRRIASGF